MLSFIRRRKSTLTYYEFFKPVSILLFSLPIFYFGFMMSIFAANNNLFWMLLREDSVLESFQVFLYLFAALVALITSLHFRKNRFHYIFPLLYLMATLGMFFIAMEEISWGQRVFDIDTPKILKESNLQQELTIHNLGFIQRNFLHIAYILIGLGAGLAWLILPEQFVHRWEGVLRYIVPSPTTTFYFLPLGLFYIYLDGVLRSLWPDIGGTKPQEMFETAFAAGFFVFFVAAFLQVRQTMISNTTNN